MLHQRRWLPTEVVARDVGQPHKATMLVDMGRVKRICAMILLAAACAPAAADTVPVPRPRPAPVVAVVPAPGPKANEAAPPSACRLRLTPEVAIAPSLPPLSGPGECGAPDLVRLEAVVLPDNSRVAVTPPATLRCSMAEAIVSFVRVDASELARELGASLRAVQNYASYDCRGRNRVAGAKTSEHGKGNALDVRGLTLTDGRFVELTDPHVARDFREKFRASACARFATVLGPGSDGYHENHIHLDLAVRNSGYRFCQWDVRSPEASPPAPTATGSIARVVPLPPPRPKADTNGGPKP